VRTALAALVISIGLLSTESTAQQPSLPDSLQRLRDAGGRIGAVNAVLSWNTIDDLDIQAICPNGDKIYYSQKHKCGGVLDVDRNAGAKTNTPVENIVWQTPAAGPYKVLVNAYSARQPVNFKVELLIDGVKVDERTGTATQGQTPQVLDFTLPYVRRQ
jgi:uncharacterized protein YfaP (DUF2135 family)